MVKLELELELELKLELRQKEGQGTRSDKRSRHGQRGETERWREGHELRLLLSRAKAHPSASWLKCG
jgi:hypothetical protein